MDFKLLDFPSKINQKLSDNLSKVIKSGFWSTGPESKSLELYFANRYKRECICTSSGGTALQLLHDTFSQIKKIAIQSNTYFASSLPWINSNKEIILIGTESDNLMPSFNIVKDALAEGPDALIITHIGGYPNPDIQLISKICQEQGVLLIEDCAHSPFVSINKKYVGTFGDAAILSFFPTKPIPAGEGGLIIIKDKYKAKLIKKIRDYGKFKDDDGSIKHLLPAFPNARLNEFSAVVVNTILENYELLIASKRKIAAFYDTSLDENHILSKIYPKNLNLELSFYKYICFLDYSKYKTAQVYDRDNQLISIFKDNNIKFKFIGEQEYSVEHICLPITYSMTLDDAEKVIKNSY